MHLSDEDLELYLLARLPEHQLSVVESHVANCSSCLGRLSEVAGLAFRGLSLSSRLRDYDGTEKRREHRIPAEGHGQMQVFSPFSPEKIRVQIADISRNGLKVRTPRFVQRASIVQVQVKKAIILGEVRYCIESGAEFDAGIQIQDVVP